MLHVGSNIHHFFGGRLMLGVVDGGNLVALGGIDFTIVVDLGDCSLTSFARMLSSNLI